MDGDGQDEECACHISKLDQPALHEASIARSDDLAFRCPIERDKKSKRLETISQDKLINQDNRLVVSDRTRIEPLPGKHAPSDESQKA